MVNIMNTSDKRQKTSSSGTKKSVVRPCRFCELLEDNNPILAEALPYLDVVSIVDKKTVCTDWEKRCTGAINDKGRRRRRAFTGNRELRGEVERYCRGDRDDIERIAEEFGFPIGAWDVSGVEDFSGVFFHMKTFNESINDWNVSNATNMKGMFWKATSFNQSLSGWNVSRVRDMGSMFFDARDFNGDVSTWDTSAVTDMSYMFHTAISFNGDVSNWDTSSVTNINYMFLNTHAFDNVDISGWNVSQDLRNTRYGERDIWGTINAQREAKLRSLRDYEYSS